MRALTPDEQLIIEALAASYLGSRRFNGTPVRGLLALPGLGTDPIVTIRTLVADGLAEVVQDVNPHIKRFQPPDVAQQLRFLQCTSSESSAPFGLVSKSHLRALLSSCRGQILPLAPR